MEILISLVVVVVLCVAFWYVSNQLPAPANKILQIVVAAGAAIWLLTHIRAILGAISHT